MTEVAERAPAALPTPARDLPWPSCCGTAAGGDARPRAEGALQAQRPGLLWTMLNRSC